MLKELLIIEITQREPPFFFVYQLKYWSSKSFALSLVFLFLKKKMLSSDSKVTCSCDSLNIFGLFTVRFPVRSNKKLESFFVDIFRCINQSIINLVNMLTMRHGESFTLFITKKKKKNRTSSNQISQFFFLLLD